MSQDVDHVYGHKLGFGRKPALLVCDVTKGYSDPRHPRGMDMSTQKIQINQLITFARSYQYPIIFSRIAFEPADIAHHLWLQKIPSLQSLLTNSTEAEIADDVYFQPQTDHLISKKGASVFLGTDMVSILNSHDVDTLILTGATTSGCVYMSAVDTIQHGYRPIVAEDAVIDRWQDSHDLAIKQLQSKYADVVSTADIIAHYRC
ncbi:isochorismatase family protein [Shewanella surugensis]|uniref:Isochorismatase family protein n=1 Tax=Shewanella surugensis TaxID=212020 RepID=A0ABT0L6S2_9GAMM|nr:isochorismatase family protein [Shewanella surugensis]MCL1123371.1 isochorismatase family protein [Shewanella surugensis]